MEILHNDKIPMRMRYIAASFLLMLFGSFAAASSPKGEDHADGEPDEPAITAQIEQRSGDQNATPANGDGEAEEQASDRPSAGQIADWVREAYAGRQELAYDFSVTQAQKNDHTWTYQGSARYSGLKSVVMMTEVEGTRVGRRLRYACDIDGDQAVFTEDTDGNCITYTLPTESLEEPAYWKRRLHVETNCIYGNLLRSWLGSDPVSHRVNYFQTDISKGKYMGDETVTDANGTAHDCYAVMNGVEGSYEVHFVDKSTHLVRRWYVDRTTISRDSVYTYRTPEPAGPDTFRLECPQPGDAASDDGSAAPASAAGQ